MVPVEPKIVVTDRIPADAIDPDALKVIRRLRHHGHEAYLVGGCVRDLLNGIQPKDFDVITSAKPRQVRRLFANSRVIGRRFRLVHVIFGENVIEVSTFRADPSRLAAEGVAEVPGFGDELEDAAQPGSEPESNPPSDASDLASDEAELDDDDDDGDGEEEELDEEEEPAPEAGPDDERAPEVPTVTRAESAPPEPDEPLEPAPGGLPGGSAGWSDIGTIEGDAPRGGARPDDFDLNNLFGDPEQDARRRDFTVNALFYDPAEQKIIDYTDGLSDIDKRLLRTIRDPEVSFAEDPVRMIRAARFAAKLGFEIEASGLAAIGHHKELLLQCSQRRLLEEVFKILKGGHAASCLELMDRCGLLAVFLPEVAAWLAADPNPQGLPPAPVEGAAEATAGETGEAPAPEAVEPVEPVEPVEAAAPEAPEEDEDEEEAEPAGEAAEAAPQAGSSGRFAKDVAVERPNGRCVAVGGGPDAFLYPEDDWSPDERLVRAFLRVTWERPPTEGANDWVEDPHVYMMDDMFEAAAFSRDAYLEQLGNRLAGEASERARAAAVLKILRWNGRLGEIVASFPEDELSPRRSRRRRRRRGGNGARVEQAQPAPSAPSAPAAPVVPAGLSRRELLLGYLRALDLLSTQGVSLSNSLQLSALFGPLLLTAIETRDPSTPSERVADDVLFPLARRHSLARRDRDGIKRTTLHLRRLVSGELRRRGRGRVDRLLARDHFRESVVLMWMHCKATGNHWDELRYWERRVKSAGSSRSR